MIAEVATTIRERAAQLLEEQTEFLAALVHTPSDNPPGDCRAIADTAAGWLEHFGWMVERYPVPENEARATGMMAVTNLVVRRSFGAGPIVALNAHGDVVPPGGGWTTEPYGAEIREGWLYGRGAAVSKSDFATYAGALRALEDGGAALGGTVELHLTFDEEVGGNLGPGWLLHNDLVHPDYAICAGFTHGIVTAHNGCLHLEVEILGRSAHAARPKGGADALEAATQVLTTLYRMRESYSEIRSSVPGISHPTLTVGLIQGGINTNVVPDRVVLRLDRRLIPEENMAAVEAEITDAVLAAASRVPGCTCHVRVLLRALPLNPLPGTERLAGALQARAAEILGHTPMMHGVPLYADARHYAEAGIPTVMFGAGPRTIEEANAHRADERVALVDLRDATVVVALAVADILTT